MDHHALNTINIRLLRCVSDRCSRMEDSPLVVKGTITLGGCLEIVVSIEKRILRWKALGTKKTEVMLNH